MNGLLSAEADDANLIVDCGIVWADFGGLTKELFCQDEVVGSEVLHADAQIRCVRTVEETRSSSVGGHRLIRLVLSSECVTETNPTRKEVIVQLSRFTTQQQNTIIETHVFYCCKTNERT